jgi:hypothetical protein
MWHAILYMSTQSIHILPFVMPRALYNASNGLLLLLLLLLPQARRLSGGHVTPTMPCAAQMASA